MAVIENHYNDSLANIYSNSRNNFYGITGYPKVYFDGVISLAGGSGTSSWYNTYVPYVNQRLAVASDFTINVDLEATDGDYAVTVTVDNVGGNTESNLVLHFVITESKLPIVWGLTEEQDFINRLMVPDQNGTPLDFTGSSTQIANLEFNTSYWDVDNCEMIVFVQNTSTKEIKQGTKRSLAIAEHDIDAEANAVIFPTGTFCGVSSFEEPIVQIRNNGAEDLTSVDIEYSINGGATQNYTWTGDLDFGVSKQVALPGINFTPAGTNTFEFTVSNPNGEVDPNPENNTTSGDFNNAYEIGTEVILELKTDNFATETTWEMKDENGTILYSGGPYISPLTVYTETFTIDTEGCIEFIIYDAYGDGICCESGEGYYKLFDENMTEFFAGGDFAEEETTPFSRSVNVGIGDQLLNNNTTQLYPNPATDIVNIVSNYNMKSVTVYNFAGQVVHTESVNSTSYRVNTSEFQAGIYLFQIETEEGRIAKRVILE